MRRAPFAIALAAVVAAVLTLLSAPAGAIYGGTPVVAGNLRAAGFVIADGDGGLTGSCGGTLVTPTTVVTAAHCVVPDDMYVALDVTDLNDVGQTGELHAVANAAVHPQWEGSIEYDLAVLTLDRPSLVPPVRVVEPSEAALWATGTTATVAGWGITSASGDPSSELLEATVPIVDETSCASNVVFCAGDGDPAVCAGDSGGPLLVDDDGTLVLAGVIAAGQGECGSSPTDLYAEIGSEPLQSWLRGEMAAGEDTTAPKVRATTPTGSRVARRTHVWVTFSEPVDPATVGRSTYRLFRLTADGARRVRDVVVEATVDGTRARLDPYGDSRKQLAGTTRYRVVVTTGIRDLSGNRLDQTRTTAGGQGKSWTFRTAR